MIPFNKPYIVGSELNFIEDAIMYGLSGSGKYTELCYRFFNETYGFKDTYLTHSCTAALEMCGLLLDLKEGDEVILPSYTFTSSANAFLLRGATVKFADSTSESPNLCLKSVQESITSKTKAIVVVHYAGMSCDMHALKQIAVDNRLILIEDAAQAIDAKYDGQFLGSFGHLSTFSFHDTKNIHCGEGGLLVINDTRFIEKAGILYNYGTNKEAFISNKVDKYEWCGIGSSFMCSELNAAFLWGQLQNHKRVLEIKISIWWYYHQKIGQLNLGRKLVSVNERVQHNGHIYYLVCDSKDEREALIQHMNEKGVKAFFHYQALHNSPFFSTQYSGPKLPYAELYSDCLVRLPVYAELTQAQQDQVIDAIRTFYLN